MFRYLLALIVIVCLSDAASACQRPHLFGHLRAGIVHRERHVVRERGAILPRLIVAPAAPCAALSVPVPPKK